MVLVIAFMLGASWETGYELHNDAYPDSIFFKKTRFSVESISETVTVPAGIFNNCIKIRAVHTNSSGNKLRVFYRYLAQVIGETLSIMEIHKEEVRRSELIDYSIK